MTGGGTLPGRKPCTRIWLPIFLYAACTLGCSSSNGTLTVSRTRVGLSVSTAVSTVLVRLQIERVVKVVGAGRLELPISCSQSRRASHYATPRGAASV